MSLADDARELAKPKGPRSNLHRVLAEHPEIAEELFEALNDLEIAASGITGALQKRDITLTRRTIERYRRSEYEDFPFPYTPE